MSEPTVSIALLMHAAKILIAGETAHNQVIRYLEDRVANNEDRCEQLAEALIMRKRRHNKQISIEDIKRIAYADRRDVDNVITNIVRSPD